MTTWKQEQRDGAAAPARARKSAAADRTTASPGPDAISMSRRSAPIHKRAMLIDRLSQPEGARIDDLIKELGWLPHTVRAALTGLRRKGYAITRTRTDGEGTIYRAALSTAEMPTANVTTGDHSRGRSTEKRPSPGSRATKKASAPPAVKKQRQAASKPAVG